MLSGRNGGIDRPCLGARALGRDIGEGIQDRFVPGDARQCRLGHGLRRQLAARHGLRDFSADKLSEFNSLESIG